MISANNRVMNLKGLSKTDESGFAQVSAPTPRTRRTVGTILHMAADAKIPLSAVVAQHRVPVAQSGRIESYPVDTSCAMLAHLKASEGAVSHLSMGPDAMMAINDVDGLRLTFDGWRVLHIRPSGNARK
ncbi:hypothetical protein X772_31970 [Mesorhizobium sp. LSJC280B00]|nr:hypothetical protein X772_31970 [Mesorhizobium sp. LSJC280B00]